MSEQPRLRGGLRGVLAYPSAKVALALVVVGLLFALVELQSPSSLYWTGQAVQGTNSGGIVYYQYNREDFTVDAPGAAPSHDTPVTVYVDPADPGQGLVSRSTRWVDAAGVLGWFVAAAACLGVAAFRRASARRRTVAAGSRAQTFGDGLSPDLMERYLDQARRPPSRPPEA
jgi:hypothetical protein